MLNALKPFVNYLEGKKFHFFRLLFRIILQKSIAIFDYLSNIQFNYFNFAELIVKTSVRSNGIYK